MATQQFMRRRTRRQYSIGSQTGVMAEVPPPTAVTPFGYGVAPAASPSVFQGVEERQFSISEATKVVIPGTSS